LFETLKQQPTLFAYRLAKFMGIDATLTYELLMHPPINTAHEHRVHNLREKWLPGVEFSRLLSPPIHEQALYLVSDLFARYWPRRAEPVSPENLARLKALYGPSNHRLITDFGLDVAEYGYLL
jgi:hypothetical protein